MAKQQRLGSGADLLQSQLFANCAATCEAFYACGGNRRTAPCMCAFPVASPLHKQCSICSYNCRERFVRINEFPAQIAAGLTLEESPLRQPASEPLPVFMPLHTHNVRLPSVVLPFKWVSTDAQSFLNPREHRAAALKPKFASQESMREYLRISSECQVLALFNSPDWVLESFWAMPRQELFRNLRNLGIEVATGPTFSIINRTSENTLVPHANHVTMLLRHHRVIAEQQAAGIAAIPNLYWPDDDTTQFNRLVAWLRDNPHIHTVSRDFSMGNGPRATQQKLKTIIRLLDAAGRSFRVIIIGTGPANAPRIIKQLIAAGHTCSIASAAPIMAAIHNDEYIFNDAGELVQQASNKSKKPALLMLDNLMKFNILLEGVVESIT